MILPLLLMLATGMATAFVMLSRANRSGHHRLASLPVVASLGMPLGAGLTSCVAMISLQVGVLPHVSGLVMLWGVALCAVGVSAPLMLRAMHRGSWHPAKRVGRTWRMLTTMPRGKQALLTLAIFAMGGAMLAAANAYMRAPIGQYDAWAIWNLRAHFMYVAGDDWRLAFDSAMSWSHTDYPLLLPLAVWNGWHAMGAQDIYWPAMVAVAFAASTALALFSFTALLTGTARGALVVTYLLVLPFFADKATWQYADMPLACYMLGAIGATALAWRRSRPGWAICALAGAMAGFAAFTKNEGLVFAGALTLSACAGLAWRGQWRQIAAWLAGLVPGLLCVVMHKLTLASTNDLVVGSRREPLLSLLTDPQRHGVIAQRAADIVPDAVQPMLLLTLTLALLLAPGRGGLRRPSVLLVTGFPLLVMLLAYDAAYLVAPQDLSLYLNTSLDRLVLQWLPMALLWLAMCMRWLGAKGYGLGSRRGRGAIATG